jgi:hypothetical protein
MSLSPFPTDPARLLELGATLERSSLWEQAAKVYDLVLDTEPTNTAAILASLTVAVLRANPEGVAQTLARIGRAVPGAAAVHAMIARVLLQIGYRDAAIDAFRRGIIAGADPTVRTELVRVLLPGPPVRQHLEWIHHLLRPATYLELGNGGTDTIGLARPPTRAIALVAGAGASAIATARGERTIDLALIAGAGTAVDALDSLITLAPHCAPSATILLTDSMPVAAGAPNDLWKLPGGLRHALPELRVATLPAPPTGLTVIGRPDPDALRAAREAIAGAMAALDFDAFAARLPALIGERANELGATARVLGLRP